VKVMVNLSLWAPWFYTVERRCSSSSSLSSHLC